MFLSEPQPVWRMPGNTNLTYSDYQFLTLLVLMTVSPKTSDAKGSSSLRGGVDTELADSMTST